MRAPAARQVEILISNLLRVGVVVSLSVVCVGTVISFAHHPAYLHSSPSLAGVTRPGAAFPHTVGQVAIGIRQLHGQAIVAAGLLLLIATPVLRVAVSIIGFVYEADRTFVLITSIVLALLLLSFALGQAER